MSQCRYCQIAIHWVRRDYRNVPLEEGGAEHHCPNMPRSIARHRGPRADSLPGVLITGERYTPSCGQCDVPPWETCACSFKEAT